MKKHSTVVQKVSTGYLGVARKVLTHHFVQLPATGLSRSKNNMSHADTHGHTSSSSPSSGDAI